ncbi:MAG: formylglycine-generating enzyme family protein [Desulfobacteraceae bacterium]|uniref:Formylglycine-generating enzyme family protein n=1 Tax=Candidatus Desulfacyla euxinica TaxID=2841693 RepID=A0A8J6T4V0_9DELT|nr:formylglycine-generating enzyme family protein [Candidatus Desulfacyla euxinica]MBL6977356.1 formylglycine-generating enzyme family protein [Desulfobacteraceae bacterium]
MKKHIVAGLKTLLFQVGLILFLACSLVMLWAAGGSGGEPKPRVTNSLGMTFAYVPPGTFKMGSPTEERGRFDDETRHRVTLTKGFYLQTTEVTQGQWTRVMGDNPSNFDQCGSDCPVESVSWNDVQDFIQKINKMEGEDRYRLPTESEWEYACRAGSKLGYCFDSKEHDLQEYAWFDMNSEPHTHPVGQKTANRWGLFDMHGNVWEWCQDHYRSYPDEPVIDPPAAVGGTGRIRRGGGWKNGPRDLRCANRGRSTPEEESDAWGFRLVLIP